MGRPHHGRVNRQTGTGGGRTCSALDSGLIDLPQKGLPARWRVAEMATIMSDMNSSRNFDRGDRPDRGDRGGDRGFDRGGDDGDKRRQPRRYRRKVLDTRNLVLDYKSAETLERFISRTGKILPRRMTGATAKIQRKIAREIRIARNVGLLPFARR